MKKRQAAITPPLKENDACTSVLVSGGGSVADFINAVQRNIISACIMELEFVNELGLLGISNLQVPIQERIAALKRQLDRNDGKETGENA